MGRPKGLFQKGGSAERFGFVLVQHAAGSGHYYGRQFLARCAELLQEFDKVLKHAVEMVLCFYWS